MLKYITDTLLHRHTLNLGKHMMVIPINFYSLADFVFFLWHRSYSISQAYQPIRKRSTFQVMLNLNFVQIKTKQNKKKATVSTKIVDRKACT